MPAFLLLEKLSDGPLPTGERDTVALAVSESSLLPFHLPTLSIGHGPETSYWSREDVQSLLLKSKRSLIILPVLA